MMYIGTKIKELRKKNDMTQEQLADYLNVSFQAVSKWETGVAIPDLALIAPLTRLFKISADELLGISQTLTDARREELHKMWDETYESGDTAIRLKIAQTAVREYPGDINFIYMLAESEFFYANHNLDYSSKEFMEYYEKAVKHYQMVLEDPIDNGLKNDALFGLVMTLPNLERNEEAINYAKQHPNGEDLLLYCLSGEEKEIQRQKLIQRDLYKLLSHLEYGQNDYLSIKAAEKIAKIIVDDGNYLYMNEWLSFNSYLQAVCLVREGNYDMAIEMMQKCYEYSLAADKTLEDAKDNPLNYTCHILSKLSFNIDDYHVSGTESNVDNFREWLRGERLSPLFDREDYRELLKL